MGTFLFAFPEFNSYSTALLVLVTQGVLLAVLLYIRAYKRQLTSDFLLGTLLLITCYHRTTYTIGFMGWYDTFRNTKINYYLIPLTFAVGPLIYLYLKAVTTSAFKFRKVDWLHFLPLFLFVSFRIFILIYDRGQPGFDLEQNGVLMKAWNMGPAGNFFSYIETIQQAVYLAFALQLYYAYRTKLRQFFSNTYSLELRWMRNLLFIYVLLFLYGNIQHFFDLQIQSMTWIQKWWKDFVAALAILYMGVRGYFTPPHRLLGLKFNLSEFKAFPKAENLDAEKQNLIRFMESREAFLKPDLNLEELATDLGTSRAQLSRTINTGFGKNFNDFINSYRIARFKEHLQKGHHHNHSLLGLAFESGFNSKATFNRVFQKLEGYSPSSYLKTLKTS